MGVGNYCALKIPPQANNNNKKTLNHLFQMNCYSLKAAVTSLERFRNPAEHDSVELLPEETAVAALTGSDPTRTASRLFLSTPLHRGSQLSLHLCELSKTPPCLLSPFSSLSTWGCTGERESSSLSCSILPKPPNVGGEGERCRRCWARPSWG